MLPILLRFVGTAVAATGVAIAYQDDIVRWLLPLFQAWLGWMDDAFRTLDLSVVSDHGESVVRRISTTARVHLVGTTFVYPDPLRQYSTQAASGIALQPLILAISLLLAWPRSNLGELALRFALAAMLMPLVLVLDVPTMLWGFAYYEDLKAFDPDGFSLLVSWADAMNAGGRFVLTLLAVVLAVAAASVASGWPRRACVKPPVALAPARDLPSG